MADELLNQQSPAGTDSADPWAFSNDEMKDLWAFSPEEMNELNAPAEESEEAPEVPDEKSQASIWEQLSYYPRMALRATDAAGRELIDSFSDISIDSLSPKKTHLLDKAKDPQQAENAKAFIKWAENKHIPGKEDIPELGPWAGGHAEGVNGFIEDMAQGVLGYAVGNKAAKLKGASSFIAGGVGDVASTFFFMENDEDFSNIVQEYAKGLPEPLQGPVIAALSVTAIEEDDETWERNLKAFTEGVLIEGTARKLGGLIRWVRASRRAKQSLPMPPELKADLEAPAAVDPLSEFHAGNSSVEPPSMSSGVDDPLAEFHGPADGAAAITPKETPKAAPAPKPGVNIGRTPEGGYQVTIDGRPVGPVVGTYNEAQALGVTAEVVHKNDQLPLGKVLDEDLEAFKKHGDGSKIRVAYAQGRNEVIGVINQIAQPGMPTSIVGREKAPRPSKAKGGKPWARPKVLELAESVFPGKKGQAAVDEAIAVLGDADPVTIGPRIQALRTWTHAQVANINRLREMADGGRNAIAQHELGRALDTLARVYNIFPEATHAEALAPDAFSDAAKAAAKAEPKAPKGKSPKDPPAPKAPTEKPAKKTAAKDKTTDPEIAPEGSPQVFEGKTRKEVQALNTALGVAGDDPQAILAVLRGPSEKTVKEVAKKNPGLARKVGDFMQAWRINAMLSGHITHLGNIASNAGVMFLRPVEMGLAGVFQGNTAKMREGWDLTTGLFLSIKDSLKMAGQAFKKGDGILDAGAGTFDLSHPTIGEWSFNSPKAYGTLPSRMLMTEDEFFKQMNYRAKVRADILREARERGVTDKASLKKLVEEGLSLTFDGQKGMVSQSGLDYARYNTFTTPFEKDSFMGDIQSALQRDGLPAWIGRQVVPFLRTPTRIFEFAVERTPGVNLFHKEMRDSLFGRKGPEAAAQAYAKLTTGTAMYAAGYFLAGAGIITGSGPSDPTLRATMMSQGWKPYSVRVGDTYIPYNRMHPLTSALGVMADYVSISGELKDEENGQAAAAIITMLSARSSDNTFVTGLHEFLEVATSENPADVERYLAAYAGSYIPNALHQANPDGVLRETRDWVDQLMRKSPGFGIDGFGSPSVEPRRNIFGEVALKNPGGSDIAFHPFTSSSVEDPEIFNEMVELGRGLQMPPVHMNVKGGGKLDLKDRSKYDNGTGQSPYNRMLEIMGGPMKEGGPTLREEIRTAIRSEDYKKAETHDGYKPGGDRWNIIQTIINNRKQAAEKKMLSEYPALQAAMQAEMAFGLAGKHGGKKAAQQAKRNVEVDIGMKALQQAQ